jgi:hypothetical protein
MVDSRDKPAAPPHEHAGSAPPPPATRPGATGHVPAA